MERVAFPVCGRVDAVFLVDGGTQRHAIDMRSVDLARGTGSIRRRFSKSYSRPSDGGFSSFSQSVTTYYVVLKHPALDQARYGAVVDTINRSIYMGLLVVCTIATLQLLFDCGKLILNANRRRNAVL